MERVLCSKREGQVGIETENSDDAAAVITDEEAGRFQNLSIVGSGQIGETVLVYFV